MLNEAMTRISRAEWFVAAAVTVVLAGLVLIEPDILGAPFENERTILFTFGGTAVAAVALVAMLRWSVPPAVRIAVLLVPFAAVNWWLLSPFFVDDVVDEEFATSIAEERDAPAGGAATADTEDEVPAEPDDGAAPSAADPVLLGAGMFVGLAGHDGSGDAGVFRDPDGRQVVRFERFDIENGPDLEVYLVPGADQTTLADGSVHLGSLKGNVGDQTYDVPPGQEIGPGVHTVLVWCEAFDVEFVGATITIS